MVKSGNALQLSAFARAEIEGAGLIAADNASFGPRAIERHGKTGCAREIPATRDRDNYWSFRYAVEGFWRHDEDRTPALLLVSQSGIKPDQPDVAALHQINSPPAGLPSSHSRSSLVRRALGLHWANNPDSV